MTYLWEDLGHRINTIFHGLFAKTHNFQAIGHKMSSKEEIHEIHLTKDIDQVQDFTEDVFGHIQSMGPKGSNKVIYGGESLFPFGFRGIQTKKSQIFDQHVYFATFLTFPQIVRQVE